jgi:hypothetical protein
MMNCLPIPSMYQQQPEYESYNPAPDTHNEDIKKERY